MIHSILAAISGFIIATISVLGYGGIILLMAIESACIPLPSEVIMPFSGFLVFDGRFNLWLIALAGAVGCVLGSAVAYWVGMYGGRPLIERYGKYILISHHDLDLADRWFKKYGDWAIFFSRLLPVVRTYISFPAGIARMRFGHFVLYTFLGSFPWCLGLGYIGLKMGQNWDSLKKYFHGADYIIAALIIIGIVWWIWRHLKNRKKYVQEENS
jgi:membrane protein DedA with SNARE-associated domain